MQQSNELEFRPIPYIIRYARAQFEDGKCSYKINLFMRFSVTVLSLYIAKFM